MLCNQYSLMWFESVFSLNQFRRLGVSFRRSYKIRPRFIHHYFRLAVRCPALRSLQVIYHLKLSNMIWFQSHLFIGAADQLICCSLTGNKNLIVNAPYTFHSWKQGRSKSRSIDSVMIFILKVLSFWLISFFFINQMNLLHWSTP